jgi:hypothetical protein
MKLCPLRGLAEHDLTKKKKKEIVCEATRWPVVSSLYLLFIYYYILASIKSLRIHTISLISFSLSSHNMCPER